MPNVFTFKIGGEAGFGIKSAGESFSKIALRSGFNVFNYIEYPSLVRGGHNVMQVTFSEKPVYSQYVETDFLVALNQETVDLHKNELKNNGGLLYDSSTTSMQKIKVTGLPAGVTAFPVPLTDLARKAGVSMIMRNTIALAASVGLLGGNLQFLKDILAAEFADKPDSVRKLNEDACDAGYGYVMENFGSNVHSLLKSDQVPKKSLLLTGNDAVALGAVAAGMNFMAIYPMTPTSNILHILAPVQEKYGFIYKQPEDEISAINMAIGAAHAGARTMVATSGGGFCLMAEGYGLAGITELPVVIIEGMRGAPATGLPTWTEQGDLKFVLSAHQGDFPRIVLAAGDIGEAFHLTMLAFNLAEKYQNPVIVLVDKYLCESHMNVPPFDYSDYEVERGKFSMSKTAGYKRYALSDDGVSMRSTPGSGNYFVSNSDEHTEVGYSSEEADNRISQMEKRMKKLKTCEFVDMVDPVIYGSPDAKTTIVSWGSNKMPILEALKQLPDTNYLHLTWMQPFPAEFVTKMLNTAKNVINIECNYSAQMRDLIRQNTGINIEHNLLKYDGRPFYPHEIIRKVKEVTNE